MTTHGVAPFPLYWPLQHPRTTSRRDARFQVDFVTARTALLSGFRLLGARDVVLSTNIPIRRDGLPGVPDREPQDPGAAVYFTRKGKPFVIACDHFARIRWNLRAIGCTLEALRSIERHGATSMLEQAFSGLLARVCASCGCSDLDACDGGCSWVDGFDDCSACLAGQTMGGVR